MTAAQITLVARNSFLFLSFQWTSEHNFIQREENGRPEAALPAAAAEMQRALQRHSRDPTHNGNR